MSFGRKEFSPFRKATCLYVIAEIIVATLTGCAQKSTDAGGGPVQDASHQPEIPPPTATGREEQEEQMPGPTALAPIHEQASLNKISLPVELFKGGFGLEPSFNQAADSSYHTIDSQKIYTTLEESLTVLGVPHEAVFDPNSGEIVDINITGIPVFDIDSFIDPKIQSQLQELVQSEANAGLTQHLAVWTNTEGEGEPNFGIYFTLEVEDEAEEFASLNGAVVIVLEDGSLLTLPPEARLETEGPLAGHFFMPWTNSEGAEIPLISEQTLAEVSGGKAGEEVLWRQSSQRERRVMQALAADQYVRPEVRMFEDPNELFPWIYRKTFHYTVELADGRVIENSVSIALDETVFHHPEVPMIGFDFNTEYHDPQGTIDLLGKCILEMHYHSWLADNPNSPLDFEGYLSLVADGGGQYTFKGSQESPDSDYSGDEFRTFSVVTADPGKPMALVMSHQRRGNPAWSGARSYRRSYWAVMRSDGSFAMRSQIDDDAKNAKLRAEESDLAPYGYGLFVVATLREAGYALSYPEEMVKVGPAGGEIFITVNTDVRDAMKPFQPTSRETVDRVPLKAILP